MTEQPLFSIVVTAYTMDRFNDIIELLKSIKAQTYPHVETILVIERSTELLDRLKQYVVEKEIPHVKVVFNDGEWGLSAGRNLGVAQSSGKILAFIDDDAFPFSDWAEQIVKTYDDDTVIGVTGPSIPLWEDKKLAWVPEEFYWIVGGSGYSEWTEKREIRNVSGTNMSFRREAFDSSGLFLTQLGARGGGETGKHELVGDETEFSIRVNRKTGKRILYNPDVKVKHRVYKFRVSPAFVARRAYWEGYTKALFKRSYRDTISDNKLLRVEYQLLRRIFSRLLPSILLGLFSHPIIAICRLSITINAVFFVAVGYLSYSIRSITGRGQNLMYEHDTRQ